MKQSCDGQLLVESGSLYCLKSVENRNIQNLLILEMRGTLDELLRPGYSSACGGFRVTLTLRALEQRMQLQNLLLAYVKVADTILRFQNFGV